MSDPSIRKIVRFSGHVQGVGFRMTTVSLAKDLAVSGHVRNEPDGSVTMDVEGHATDIKTLLKRIKSEMSGYIDSISSDDRKPLGRSGAMEIHY